MGTVTLKLENGYRSVTRNTAQLRYTVSGYENDKPDDKTGDWVGAEPANGTTWTQNRAITKYGDIKYKWSFLSYSITTKTGLYTAQNLNPGSFNTIRVYLTVSCESKTDRYKRTKTRSPIPATETTPAGWGPWSGWSSEELTSSTNNPDHTMVTNKLVSIGVYTKPSQFSWSGNISANETIELNLSADDWNILCQRIVERQHWISQNSNFLSVNASVSSGDLITAYIYNKAASILGIDQVTSDETIIRASHFTALATAVNQ